MKKTIITCDVCKEEKDKMISVYLSFNGNFKSRTFDVCKDCCLKANIFDEKFVPACDTPKTTAEQLFDLLEEIARNAVEQ